ncbi:MAG TPA: PAS domain S-box protein [Terriglobales bacterium]|nr:PAS domain S-box protein [Terriglobales bacterium]
MGINLVLGLDRQVAYGQVKFGGATPETDLFDLIHDAVIAFDTNHVITFWNRGAEDIFGWKKSEAIGQLSHELLGYPGSEPTGGVQCDLLEGGVWDGEIQCHRRDGRRLLLHSRIVAQRDSGGRPVGMFQVCRDITQEAAVREHRDFFFCLSLDLLCVAGLDGYFKRLNPAWERLLHYSIGELLSKPYLEFVHPDDRSRTLTEAAKIEHGNITFRFENRYLCKDGEIKWLLWDAFLVPEEQLIYAAARDITDYVRMRREVQQMNEGLERRVQQRTTELSEVNRELESFTYSVSHDLRAPLRQINGFAHLLAERLNDQADPAANHCLTRIQEGVDKMERLTESLLRLSHISRLGMQFQLTDLDAIVAEAIETLRPEIGNREIAWKIEPLVSVECDAALMKLVFTNLISNAIKFTAPRRHAVIRVGQETIDGCAHIVVSDNGVGFEMIHADKLFGVFQRLHRQEDFPGTGVGLAIVQRILNRHGWLIRAESELDRGTAFYLRPSAPNIGDSKRATPNAC